MSDYQHEKAQVWRGYGFYGSVLAGGLSLALLLPVGCFSLTGALFTLCFGLHIAALAVSLAAVVPLMRRILRESESRLFSLFLLAGAMLFLVFAALAASAPIAHRDALIHHLAVPKWWLTEGRIVPFDWHEWSYYPMLVELAYTGLLRFGLERLTPFYHFTYLILLAAVITQFVLARTGDGRAALLAFFLTTALPIALNLAAAPQVDLPLALFSAVACFALIEWGESGRPAFLVEAGLALGLALSCKYNGLPTALLLLLLLPLLTPPGKALRTSVTAAASVAGLALLVFSPWLIKNYLWTGNPLYPYFSHLFHGKIPPVVGYFIPNPLEQRLLMYEESWPEVLALPLRMLFFGQDNNPRRFDGVLSPLLLLAIAPILKQPRRSWVRYLTAFAGSYWIVALLSTSARARYLAPVFGPLLALTACGAVMLAAGLPARGRRLVLLSTAAIQILLTLSYALPFLSRTDAAPYLAGHYSKEQYLTRHVPDYPMAQYVNRELAPDARIYLISTGNRFYYYNRAVYSAGHHSTNALLDTIKKAGGAEDIARKLKEDGITHLVLHTARVLEELSHSLSKEEAELWNAFQKTHLQQLQISGEFSLWQVK